MKITKVLREAEDDLAHMRRSIIALLAWHRYQSLKPEEERVALRGLAGELRAVANALSAIP
ncbi:MAG: hypothetical protein ACE145_21620 [Terriglobia bacterium]